MNTATALKCLAVGAALSMVMVSSRAEAAGCMNDIDCPDSACGGQVCDYDKGMTCQPAGSGAKGLDGWCSKDSDCKCMGMGATCVGVYCSFTMPPGGGSGGADGGSGGASATGDASGSGGSAATGGSAASGGASGSGGKTAASGGSTGPTGSGGESTGASSSGGCSVGGSRSASFVGLLFGLSVLGLRRSRRRA